MAWICAKSSVGSGMLLTLYSVAGGCIAPVASGLLPVSRRLTWGRGAVGGQPVPPRPYSPITGPNPKAALTAPVLLTLSGPARVLPYRYITVS